MPHGNPAWGFLGRQHWCFRHLEKVLNPEHTWADHNDTTKGFGEQIAIVLQVGEDLHACEDRGYLIFVSGISGGQKTTKKDSGTSSGLTQSGGNT